MKLRMSRPVSKRHERRNVMWMQAWYVLRAMTAPTTLHELKNPDD
jgi:hypothetical protein